MNSFISARTLAQCLTIVRTIQYVKNTLPAFVFHQCVENPLSNKSHCHNIQKSATQHMKLELLASTSAVIDSIGL